MCFPLAMCVGTCVLCMFDTCKIRILAQYMIHGQPVLVFDLY